jgi:hypothetical protein
VDRFLKRAARARLPPRSQALGEEELDRPHARGGQGCPTRLLDPSYVNNKPIVTAQFVQDACCAITRLDREGANPTIKDLLRELPNCKVLSSGVIFDCQYITAFTDNVLQFWRQHQHCTRGGRGGRVGGADRGGDGGARVGAHHRLVG